MPRFLLGLLLCVIYFPALAQEPQPPEPPMPEPDGPPEKVTLALNPLGHVGPIRGLFFTPDGKQLISVGKDRTVQFWDVAGGERLRVLRLPYEPTATALAPDGKTLAFGGRVGKNAPNTFLVNLHDGRILTLATGVKLSGQRITALAFSHDGDQLAGAHQGGGSPVNTLWDGLKGIWEKKPEGTARIKGRSFTPDGSRDMFDIRCLAFSPDGKRIALGRLTGGAEARNTAWVADLPVGAAKPGKPLPLKLFSSVYAVAWTPDGQQVVTADEEFRASAVVFWSAADGSRGQQFKLGLLRDGGGLHFLNAEQLLLTWSQVGSGNEPRGQGQSILNLASKAEERKAFLRSGEYRLGCPSAVSADGRVAAFVGGTFQNHVLTWEVATGKQLHQLGSQLGTGRAVGWSKDGSTLGLGGLGKEPLFPFALDLKELQLREKVERSDYLCRYRANGDWSVQQNNGSLEIRQGNRVVAKPGHVTASTLSPVKEPRWCAWGDPYHGGNLHLTDLLTGKQITWFNPTPLIVYDLAPSPDGRYLVSVNESQVAYIYRIADDLAKTEHAPLLRLFLAQGEWVMWTKEGYYAASPGGEKLMGWTVDNGPERLPTFHPAQRFRARLYKPEVIKLVLEKGSVEEALKAAKAQPQQIDQLLPPQARLSLELKEAQVTVEVTAESGTATQPLTELHLLVDGRPTRLENGDPTIKVLDAGPGKTVRETWKLRLEPGTHKLSVRAMGRQTYSISEEKTIEVKSPGTVPPIKRGTLHYVGVGINQFKHEAALKLTGAVHDVQAMQQSLGAACRGRFAKVQPTVLTDEKATCGAILEALTSLEAKLKPTDVVIVHYSNHGEAGPDGGLFLLTHDSKRGQLTDTALTGQQLRDVLGRYPCPVLLILDACHSGKFPLLRPASDPLSRLLADDSCGVAVMCAALAHQKAIDTETGGVFTQGLVEGLVRAKPGVGDRLYVHNLFAYVFDFVMKETASRQAPLYLPSGSVPPIVLKEQTGP